MAFIPWFPHGTRRLPPSPAASSPGRRKAGRRLAQLALARLLHRSPSILAIPAPCPSSTWNCRAADMKLDEQLSAIEDAAVAAKTWRPSASESGSAQTKEMP